VTLKACPFCIRIRLEQFDADDGRAVVFAPLNPVTPGHLLIVPKTHVKDAASSPDITAYTYRLAAQLAKEQGGSFNLITSAGNPATQSVHHLHIHYIPRVAGDDLHLPWTGQDKD
jgi:histidine triad (HIT) family protein